MIERQVMALHAGRYVVRDEGGIEEVVVGEPTFETGKRTICDGGPC